MFCHILALQSASKMRSAKENRGFAEGGRTMDFMPLDVDENLREINPHGQKEFPIAVYLRRMNKRDEGYLILHWHDEIQFVLPQNGPILFTVGERSYTLRENEYLFINSKCLHMARPLEPVGGDYICIDIHPRFLSDGNSLIGRKYVWPFVSSPAFDTVLIDGSRKWHDEAKKLLKQLVLVFNEKEFGYEMQVRGIVMELWALLIGDNLDKASSEVMLTPAERERLEMVLRYVKEHYAEKIKLSDLAAAASLSESECSRFIKRTLGFPPIVYVNRYRIVQSTTLLKSTTMSIAEIAQAVGFGTSSYYTERFKETMNCKPLEYRRRYLAGETSA